MKLKDRRKHTLHDQPPAPNATPSVRQQDETKIESKEVQDFPSLTTDNAPEGPTSSNCPERQDEADRSGTIARDKWRLGVEVATLVVGILGLVGLLCTLNASREAMINAERPWVAYSKLRGRGVTEREALELPAVDNKVGFRLELVNVGNGPALDIVVRTGSMLLSNGGWFNCRFSSMKDPPRNVAVLPGRNVENPLLHDFIVDGMTPEVVDAINSGEKTLLVGGLAEYKDQFGIQRSTSFCVTYDPRGKGLHFPFCNCGNELK